MSTDLRHRLSNALSGPTLRSFTNTLLLARGAALQGIQGPVLCRFLFNPTQHLVVPLLQRKLRHLGYLHPLLQQRGAVHDRLQVLESVGPDVHISAGGLQQAKAPFPRADGVGLDAGEQLQVLDAEPFAVVGEPDPRVIDPALKS